MIELATLAARVAAPVYDAPVFAAPAVWRRLPLLRPCIVDSCCMEIAATPFHPCIFCRVSAPWASHIYGRQYFVRLFIRFFVCWLGGSRNHMSGRSRLHMQIGSGRVPRLIKMYGAPKKKRRKVAEAVKSGKNEKEKQTICTSSEGRRQGHRHRVRTGGNRACNKR